MYYVSVQAGTILEKEGEAAFEFEIEATDADIDRLVGLFEDKLESEHATSIRGMVPAIPYHDDQENDSYDHSLMEIYKEIHRLGTAVTKKHIESMGILQGKYPAPAP